MQRVEIDIPEDLSVKVYHLYMELIDATQPPFYVAVLKDGKELTVFDLEELK